MKTQMNKWIKKIKKVDTKSSSKEIENGIYEAMIVLGEAYSNVNSVIGKMDYIVNNYVTAKGNL